MYKDPLSIAPDDPICSATTLGTTVVGILFEKTGREISEALNARLLEIAVERDSFAKLLQPLRNFLIDKEKSIEKAKTIERQRFQERITDESLNEARDKVSEMRLALLSQERHVDKLEGDFDVETHKELVVIENEFDIGWIDIKEHIQSINSFLRDRKWADIAGGDMQGTMTSSSSYSSRSSGSLTSSLSSKPESAQVMVEVSSSLESRFKRYEVIFDQVRKRSKELDLEMRRLRLILENIDLERTYKLDISKLSAFGFETEL